MKKILGIAVMMALLVPFFSCVQDEAVDIKKLIDYPLSRGLGKFTAAAGQDYQRGWVMNAYTAKEMPKYLIIETKAGGNGLGGMDAIWNLDGWVQTNLTPNAKDGAWATPAMAFVIDLSQIANYDKVQGFSGDQKLIIQFNQAQYGMKNSIKFFEAGLLVYDLGDEIEGAKLAITADDLKPGSDAAIPSSTGDVLMWAFPLDEFWAK